MLSVLDDVRLIKVSDAQAWPGFEGQGFSKIQARPQALKAMSQAEAVALNWSL